MRASVIIAVYNRAGAAETCVASLVQSDYDDFEILLVDDGSTDDTPQRLAALPARWPSRIIRVVRTEDNRGVSGARNTGIDAARGEVCVFTDSDCTVEPQWLGQLLACLAATGAVAAGGLVIDVAPRTWGELADSGVANVSRLTPRLIGGNMAIATPIARRFRFDDALRYGADEDDLSVRLKAAGLKIAFAPNAIVHHDHPQTTRVYLRRGWNMARGAARYWYKHDRWLGIDAWPITGALVTLPLMLVDVRLGVIPLLGLLMHAAFVLRQELIFKRKPLVTALQVFPWVFAYSLVRIASAYTMLARILFGLEPEIVASKKNWLAERATFEAGAART